MAETEWLFAYGTLRERTVQRALFGREVEDVEDALVGFVVDLVRITDPKVIATSGRDRHPILRRSAKSEEVQGSALLLTKAELVAADRYEVADYARTLVVLASGRNAYVYVHHSEA